VPARAETHAPQAHSLLPAGGARPFFQRQSKAEIAGCWPENSIRIPYPLGCAFTDFASLMLGLFLRAASCTANATRCATTRLNTLGII